MDIYFIRHAQSLGNLNKIYAGVTDIDLSPKGIQSLKATASAISSFDIQKIYSSPLQRCIKTTQAIFDQKKFIVMPELMEINFGEWEGKHVSEIEKQYPHEWAVFLKGTKDFIFPNGDCILDYQKRAGQTICKLITQNNKENVNAIAIVSHHGFIKSSIAWLLLKNFSLYPHISVKNAKISCVESIENHAKLKFLNI